MSLRVFLRDDPERSMALVTKSNALVFRSNGSILNRPSALKASNPRCMVKFSALDDVDLTDYTLLRPTSVHGTLGLINVNSDIFMCVITGAVQVAEVRLGEHVQRITSVEFCQSLGLLNSIICKITDGFIDCLNKAEFDHDFHDEMGLYDDNYSSADGLDHGPAYHHRDPPIEHPCLALKKLLSDGTFYYSVNFDLTNRLQDRFEL